MVFVIPSRSVISLISVSENNSGGPPKSTFVSPFGEKNVFQNILSRSEITGYYFTAAENNLSRSEITSCYFTAAENILSRSEITKMSALLFHCG